jgi:hypothetical protein
MIKSEIKNIFNKFSNKNHLTSFIIATGRYEIPTHASFIVSYRTRAAHNDNTLHNINKVDKSIWFSYRCTYERRVDPCDCKWGRFKYCHFLLIVNYYRLVNPPLIITKVPVDNK